MKLKLITDETCPCGAGVVAESCRGFHTNGQGFEYREFSCGAQLAWSPNFSKLIEEKPCPNSRYALQNAIEVAKLKTEIAKLIEQSAIEEQTKKRMFLDCDMLFRGS